MQEPLSKFRPTDSHVCELVEAFGGMVHRLKFIHFGFKELFGTKESTRLLETTALLFFGDLNKILIDYFFLEVAKLTDPSSSGKEGEKKDNLTVQYFLERVDWPSEVRTELKNLEPILIKFGKTVKPARNKLIAHNDVKAIRSGVPLGGFKIGEEEVFLGALEKMANTLLSACKGQIWGDMVETGPGDVLDLKSALIRGVAFEYLWDQSAGDELDRLHKVLEKVKADFERGD